MFDCWWCHFLTDFGAASLPSVVSTRDNISSLLLLGRNAPRLTPRRSCSGSLAASRRYTLSLRGSASVCANPLARLSISRPHSHGGILTVHQASTCRGVSRLRLVSPYAPGSAAVATQPRWRARCWRYSWQSCSFSFARENGSNRAAGGLVTGVRSDLRQRGYANGKRGRSGTGFT